MQAAKKYPAILVVPSKKSIYRRLGRNKTVEIAPEFEMEIDNYIERAKNICIPFGVSKKIKIIKSDEKSVTLKDDTLIKSKGLAKLLRNSDEALLLAASLDGETVNEINLAIKDGRGVFGIVLDAYASECVDDALRFMMEIENPLLKRLGLRVTKPRFSAGYGDLDIIYQRVFYNLLGLKELDITINEKYMMSPEKSVIAIAGIERL